MRFYNQHKHSKGQHKRDSYKLQEKNISIKISTKANPTHENYRKRERKKKDDEEEEEEKPNADQTCTSGFVLPLLLCGFSMLTVDLYSKQRSSKTKWWVYFNQK